MNKQRRHLVMAPVIALMLLTGISAATAQEISSKPWLRTVLPEQALAYLRVPNLWGVLGAPKASAIDGLQSASANAALFEELRLGLHSTWLAPLADDWGPLPELLLSELHSPLEVAVLLSEQGAPQVLATGQLRVATVAEVQALLERIIISDPRLQWRTPLNDSGGGLVEALGQPVQLYFNIAEQRLFLLAGPGLAADALSNQLAVLQPRSEPHPLALLEAEIDASGQGLFAWLNAASAAQLAMNTAPPSALMMLQLSGALEMQQLALGMGVSEGKSRSKLVALMPPAGFRRFLPVPNAELAVTGVGAIETVAVLGLPSVADWQAFRQLLQQLNPEAAAELAEIEQNLQQEMGFGIEDWWQIIGPEWVYISDAAGQYGALRIRDWAQFDALIERLREQFALGFEQRQIDGVDYTHLSIPSLYSGLDEDLSRSEPFGLILGLSQAATHLYWKREGDYLMLASVPQVLIDRETLEASATVGDWLAQQVKLPSANAVLAIATQAAGVPLLFYQWHLQLLQYLGDIVEQPVDLFALPTPRQIELPPSGHYGFKLGSGFERLEVELVYETNPMELLFAGNTMTTIALAGIAAAIAIPAYSDYTARAEGAQSFEEIRALQTLLEDFYADQGRFPDEQEFIVLLDVAWLESEAIADLSFDPVINQLSVIMAAPDELYGDRVVLIAEVADGQIVWHCSTNSEHPELYPAECR